MSPADQVGVVVDTMVFSSMFVERPNPMAERYRRLIGQSPVMLSFQTVMELRFGALRANWGELRRRRLERRISELTVMQPDDETMTVCAKLRVDCQRIGHALADKIHNGDRWIAAAAMRLDVSVVSDDGIFENVPGLRLMTIRGTHDD